MGHYAYSRNGHFYDFITDSNLHYRVGIYNGSHLLNGLPLSDHIFYLEFILLSGNKGGNDPSVISTICSILESRLNNETDILLFNEFTADMKGPARLRYFRQVVNQYTHGNCRIMVIDPFGLASTTVVYSTQNQNLALIETYLRVLNMQHT